MFRGRSKTCTPFSLRINRYQNFSDTCSEAFVLCHYHQNKIKMWPCFNWYISRNAIAMSFQLLSAEITIQQHLSLNSGNIENVGRFKTFSVHFYRDNFNWSCILQSTWKFTQWKYPCIVINGTSQRDKLCNSEQEHKKYELEIWQCRRRAEQLFSKVTGSRGICRSLGHNFRWVEGCTGSD